MLPKVNLEDVCVVVGEPREQIRSAMLAMMRSQGLRNVRAVHDLPRLRSAIRERPVDLIVVSDDLDRSIFQEMKDVRHNRIGINPFTVITFMVDPNSERSFKRAVFSGADDVLIKPVAPIKVVERAKFIAFNRLPFIATGEYIGPDRRSGERSSKIPLLMVLNTLRDKMEGKTFTLESLRNAVNIGMKNVRTAQLDSHGLRLGYVCNLILKAYEERNITEKLEENLMTLIECLEEAAKTAAALGEGELAGICKSFARQIEEMAEAYETPADQDLVLIRKLTRAFNMAKDALSGGPAPRAQTA